MDKDMAKEIGAAGTFDMPNGMERKIAVDSIPDETDTGNSPDAMDVCNIRDELKRNI